jgi:hypothetical protein
MTPQQLLEASAEQESRVTVFRKGQVPLEPGLTVSELGTLIAAYAR